MRKFEVPLKIVENSTDIDDLMKAKRLVRVLSREELDQKARGEEFGDLIKYGSFQSLIRRLKKGNLEDRSFPAYSRTDSQVRNYDLALSLAMKGHYGIASSLMQILVKEDKVHDPLEFSD